MRLSVGMRISSSHKEPPCTLAALCTFARDDPHDAVVADTLAAFGAHRKEALVLLDSC